MKTPTIYKSKNTTSTARLVAVGKWLYGNETYMPVQVFAVNFDESYEIAKADDQLEDGETPLLNECGEQFMIAWYEGNYFAYGTRDFGGLAIHEAIQSAERSIGQKIEWTFIEQEL